MLQYNEIDLNILELTKKEKGTTCKLDKKRCQYLLPKQFKTRVKLVAESDLPNACFVQQFLDIKSPHFKDSKCWFGFVEVLRYRAGHYGFSAIEDVAKEILIWWDYCDRYEYLNAYEIVRENKEKYIPVIKDFLRDLYFVRGIVLTINSIWAKSLPLDYREYINYVWIIQLLGTLERIDATMTKEDHKNVDYVVGKLEDKDGKPLDDEDYKIFAELVGIDNEPNA